MDSTIKTLYRNDFGISFYWQNEGQQLSEKVQFVFRDTGLLLSEEEILQFAKCVSKGLQTSSNCSGCQNSSECRSLIMETPLPQLGFAVSQTELLQAHELINGTIFQTKIRFYAKPVFRLI